MKKFAAVLFLATSTAIGVYAMGSQPTSPGQSQNSGAQQPAGFGDDASLLHRPTPTPAAQTPVDPKNKKPLTATLGKDNTGKNSVTTFAPNDPKIYLVWKDDTGAKGDKVRIAWFAENTGGAVSKNKKLTEATQIVPGAGSFGSSYLLMPSGGFPVGKYRVDVYDGTKLAKSLKFVVTK